MLKIIDNSLAELLETASKKLSGEERISIYLEHNNNEFTRKDYMNYFKDISSATASRDLKKATENSRLVKNGDKKTTTYKKC